MWDRREALDRAADLLLTLAFLLALAGAIHALVHSPAFALRHVELRGAISHVTRADVVEIMQRGNRGNLLMLDLEATRAGFEKLPWVRSAALRRHWPGALEVTLEEHVALARWGDGTLVNTHGERFLARHEGALPVFTGPVGAAREIAIQYEYFRSALGVIGRTPEQVSLSSRRAWQIHLDGGVVLELGREHIEARLARFVSVYGHTIGQLNRRIEHVDLRYPNGFAVRIPELRDGAVPQRKRGSGRA